MRLTRVLAVLFLAACSSSQSCSCARPIKGGFPVAERHDNAMQIRATQSLFQWLSANGPTVIPKLLPGGMSTFTVPPACTGNKVCCTTPPMMCELKLDFRVVSLTPQAPDNIHLDTDFALNTVQNLPVEFMGTACNVSIDTRRSGSQTMKIVSDIHLRVDAMTRLTNIVVEGTTVSGIDNGDVNINEAGSSFLCALANLLFKGFVVDQLQSQVADQIGGAISDQACMKCADKTDCNAFAVDCKGGECVKADDSCVQSLGFEANLDVGGMLASFDPTLKASMDVLAVAGGYSAADTGLQLGMLGGARGAPHSPCVPMLTAPSPTPVPRSLTFTTDVLPEGARPYHLGIGVHRSHLDTLGFAAFDAGALCLHVGTPSVALLSTKTIQVIVPSIEELVHVGDAPVYLAMRPSKPPTFKLGRGTFAVDGMGMRSVDEPLIFVSVPGFAIDFYVFADERYVRVMTLEADLELPISLDVDGMGRLVPLLGDVAAAFTNLRVTNTELLAESPDDLRQAFPTLLGVAVGQLAGALGPIDLPALMGLNLKPIAVTSTDPDARGENQFLSIFADLAVAQPLVLGAETSARLVALSLPTTDEFAVSGRGLRMPVATLELGGRSVGDRALEWSWSLDGNSWSPFVTETRVEIRDSRLWLQGRHKILVRARAHGLSSSLDLTPSEVEILVDTLPPEGRLVEEMGGVRAVAQDRVTPTEKLVYRWRLGDRPAGEWTALDRLAVSPELARLAMVEVRDEAGNVGILSFHGRSTAPASGCSCEVGRSSSSSPAALIFALALIFLLRRNMIVLLVAALLAIGCNEDALTQADFEPPEHEIGRWHDIAVEKSGTFHVSAYDDATGDLAYARITDLAKPIGWQIVDGVDKNAPKDLLTGYRYNVSEPGDDVGMYSAIALTKSNGARIAYYDATNAAVKFASGGRRFSVHTIEAAGGGERVGLHAAITLDEMDVPTVAYMATGIPDGMSFKSELRVAVAKSANPTGASDWTISVVDSTKIACAGLCATGQACVMAAMVNMMPNGDPANSSCVAVDAAPCAPECAMGEACIGRKCSAVLSFPKGDLPEGTGLFTQAAREGTTLTLVYHDRAQGDLKAADRNPDGSFKVSLLDGGKPETDVGQFASARYAGGKLHVAYVDAIGDRLLYYSRMGDTVEREVIDDGLRADGPHPVGAGAALFADASGVRVAYQDQQLSDLWMAARAGSWTTQPLVAGPAGYGWWPHLTSDGTRLYLSQFVYDRASGQPIGSLAITPIQ